VKRKHSFVWLGAVALCMALLTVGCVKPTYEMQLAQDMINDAKNAGAANKPEAASNLENAEKLLREGKAKMDKYDFATAKSKFDQAYRAAKKAYEMAVVETCPAPNCCAGPSGTNHTVVKGDCLWNISGQSQYFNDPFLWPLIYDANRDMIDTAAKRSGLPKCSVDGWAHWIFPGQNLAIPLDASQSSKCDAARGAGAGKKNPYCP
jgi:nucleoid-associated protein YgaU